MVRNGRYCVYREKEYKLNEDIEDNLIILTEDLYKIDSTFIDEYGSGVYSKVVKEDELNEIYEINTVGEIGGIIVNVEKEYEDSYLVGTSNYEVAEKLGLGRCDKYYYEGKIIKDNIVVRQERTKIKCEELK